MKKKIIVRSLTVGVIIASVFIIYFANRPMDYGSAKKSSEHFLNRYQDQLENISTDTLENKALSIDSFKNKSISFYEEENQVRFEIDSQGFLGGQYWTLIYDSDSEMFGEKEYYFYKETDSNNTSHKVKRNAAV